MRTTLYCSALKMKIVFALFALFFVAAQAQQLLDENEGKIWAVLVAGSNTWDNYRHQADVCHAYQVLHNNGIPDERIIVMMYDDIANNPRNPTPGIIINHPNGNDVYAGVPKDYTGNTFLTPEVFKSVLTGDTRIRAPYDRKRRVLKSGPNDHVFINFVGHGGFGLIAFPTQEMYASELLDTLNEMNRKLMYRKLTIYMESPESRSMLSALPPNVNIYPNTADGERQSSYACYYDCHHRTFLGDVNSVNWMEYSDAVGILPCDKRKQLDIGTLVVGKFQGMAKNDVVPSYNVDLEVFKRQLEPFTTDTETRDIAIKIDHLISNRDHLKQTIKTIVQKSVHNTKVKSVLNFRLEVHISIRPCYETIVKHFSEKCCQLSRNPFAMKQMYVFANMCELDVHPLTMKAAIDYACNGQHLPD